MSQDELDESFEDMVFLSLFYGYMMLAIAGFKDMEPKFPVSHKEWKPAMTFFRGERT
jgi:hypothetical protein